KDEVLVIYPNPTTESIQLQIKTEWANSLNLRAEVFSVDGKSMLQAKGNLLDIQENINIWLKNAKSGAYVIKLITPEKVLETKLIKQNK
ncbi:MAG: T9SS C-terminal target domain-containing protein, partial [Bacteroidetes bacterium]